MSQIYKLSEDENADFISVRFAAAGQSEPPNFYQ